jgi:hypothetical protein
MHKFRGDTSDCEELLFATWQSTKKFGKVFKFQVKAKNWIATPHKSKKRGARNDAINNNCG